MLASSLFCALAVLGSSLAAPAPADAQVAARNLSPPSYNTTLLTRGATEQIPEGWNLESWAYQNEQLIGVVKEIPAEGPCKECEVAAWGNLHKMGDGKEYWDAWIVCRQKTRSLVWDIRRIGEIAHCDLGTEEESWELERTTTESVGLDVNAGATFEMFNIGASVSYKQETSERENRAKKVSCGDFRGKKCVVGGIAVREIETIEGDVKIAKDDRDHPFPHNVWKDGDGEVYPYGIRNIVHKTQREVDPGYGDGWNTWQVEGEDKCLAMFDNRYYSAYKVSNK